MLYMPDDHTSNADRAAVNREARCHTKMPNPAISERVLGTRSNHTADVIPRPVASSEAGISLIGLGDRARREINRSTPHDT